METFRFQVPLEAVALPVTLARYRRMERPIFGFYIDHISDTFCPAVVFLGLGLSPYVSFNVACVALIAFFMVTILVHVRTKVTGEFKISYGKLASTEMRAFAIVLNTAMYYIGQKPMEWSPGNSQLGFSWKQAVVLAKLGE